MYLLGISLMLILFLGSALVQKKLDDENVFM